jgi:hypothetical protein
MFDLTIGIDREQPMQTALGVASPVAVVPTTKGPPHVGASGWSFHLDAPMWFSRRYARRRAMRS